MKIMGYLRGGTHTNCGAVVLSLYRYYNIPPDLIKYLSVGKMVMMVMYFRYLKMLLMLEI